MRQWIPPWWPAQWEVEKRDAERRLADVKRRIREAELAALTDVWTNEGGR